MRKDYKLNPKQILTLWMIFLTTCIPGFTQTVSDSLLVPDFSPGELIVKARRDILTDSHTLAEFNALHKHLGAYSVSKVFPETRQIRNSELRLIYLVRFPLRADIIALAEKYRQNPLIEDAQPNYLRRTLDKPIIPNDPKYEDLWNLKAINMPEAWAIEKGSEDVAIAIVDGGIDYNHVDLKSKIWINKGEIPDNGIDDDNNGYVDDFRGWDFADAPTLPGRGDYTVRDNDPLDETGHGTHVAGIAGAAVNNGIGVAGVAWNCKLMALRAGFSTIQGTYLQDDDVSAAIVYAADNGAKSINMSWGDEVNAFVIRDAVNYAYSKGCVLAAATGNDSKTIVLYPAALKNVIAVAGSDELGEVAHWSNSNAAVDIAAPGTRVLSTNIKNDYRVLTGTSMATPHIAAVAALMFSKRPTLTNEEVRQLMVATATPLVGREKAVGAGQVNAAKALAASSSLIAKIQSPENDSGGDKFIDIIGSAAGYRFVSYQLLYGESTVPEFWTPITPGWQDGKEARRQLPSCPSPFQRGAGGLFASLPPCPLLNEQLGQWDTSTVKEGIYSIRLEVFDVDDNVVRDEIVVTVDHSPPKITDVRAEIWLNEDHYTTAILWNTDDVTSGDVYYRQVAGLAPFAPLNTGFNSNKQALFLSNNVSAGEYEYYIKSRNAAGLETIDDNNGMYYRAEITNATVTPNGFHSIPVDLPAMQIATATADFDQDGQLEIVGMETGGAGYAPVKIYERNDAGNYELVFTSQDSYYPWAVGDTDGDGLLEILGNDVERTFLMECRPGMVYPRHKIWEMEGIWGGQLVDIDHDGKQEIISRYDETNAIAIYAATGDNSYQNVAMLENPTEGSNGLGTTFAIGDFDGDGRVEIVAGDEDADLFIYENIGGYQFRQTWKGKVFASLTDAKGLRERIGEATSAYYLSANDLDGDGKSEFIVGGKIEDSEFGFARRRWVYSIFKSDGDDSYRPVWTQGIMFIRPGGNGVTTGDVDGDGKNEIMISAWPNLYVFKYDGPHPLFSSPQVERGWGVRWHHTVSSNIPLIADTDGDGFGELFFNEEERLAVYELDTTPTALLKPWNLFAIPLGESSVYLGWESEFGIRNSEFEIREKVSYNIYRGTDEEQLKIIARDIPRTEFIDVGLTKGVIYWYAVSATTSTGAETELSSKAYAKPDTPPRMISAEYFSPNLPAATLAAQASRVILKFDKPMGPSAQDVVQYFAREKGTSIEQKPSSALLDKSDKRVILAFDAGILLPGKNYDVVALNVRDTDKILISAKYRSQSFTVPTEETPTLPTDLSKAIVYPNPIRPNEHHTGKVTFANLPTDTLISIYSITGALIEQLKVEDTDRGKKEWFMLNGAASEVASGVYLYVLEANGQRRSGKLAILK
jgi:subtilisin family serine protease